MRPKKSTIFYLIAMGCAAALLLCANLIVSSLGENRFMPAKTSAESLEKDIVFSYVTKPNIGSDIMESVFIEGWTFCQTEEDNSDKEIGIILKNDKAEYSYLSKPTTMRKEVKTAYGDRARGAKHGFIYSVSTVPVSDGTYDILLYCKENEHNYGLAQTQYQLVKHGIQTVIKIAPSEIVANLDLTHSFGDAKVCIDNNERLEDGSVYVKGWAFAPGQDSTDQTVYVVLRYENGVQEIYLAQSTYRVDVANHFSDDRYIRAGYTASIPKENLQSDSYSVSVLVQQNDGIHTTAEMLKTLQSSSGSELSPAVDDFDLFAISGDGKVHLDNHDLREDGSLFLKGWAFVPGMNTAAQDIYICLRYQDGSSRTFHASSYLRPDVAEHFSDELYGSSGFKAFIPAEYNVPGETEAAVVIVNENGLHTSASAQKFQIPRTSAQQPESTPEKAMQAESTEKTGGIMGLIAVPLNALMRLCYRWTKNYTLAIILFTILTKIILLPINIWTQRNSIKMVEIMPAINELKIQYFGDNETISEETQKLYKRVHYHPLASTIPMLIQIVLLMGVIDAVKTMIGGNVTSTYAQTPIQLGGLYLLMPLGAGAAALCLGLVQNRINPLQREQDRREQIVTNAISVAISLFLGAFVSVGTCVYWIASNLLSIPNQMVLNLIVDVRKYVDFAALNKSRAKLADYNALSAGESKEDKRREQEDYKRFFTIVNKHLVFYSESSGFYKYYKSVIEYILKHTNLTVHYITSDPNDQVFEIAKEQPAIKPYYIGEKKLITLMMKMDADVVVMTMPDIETYHIKRSYVRKDIDYVYVAHGMGSTNLTLTKTSTDHYDTVVCTGKNNKLEEIERERVFGVPHRTLLEGGYPLLDEMRADYRSQTHASHAKPKILIAPSWQKDNIVDSCLEKLLERLKGHGYDITVRPHPQEVRHKRQQLEALKDRFAKDGILVQTDFSSNTTVMEADLLITDWSDIGFEFAFTTCKPVLYIDTPMKIMNPDYEQIDIEPINILLRDQIGRRLKPTEMDRLPTVVAELLNSREYYQEKIEQLAHEHIYHIDDSTEIYANYLIETILKKISEKKEKKL